MSLKRQRALDKLRKLAREVEVDGLPVRSNLYHVAALTHRLIGILDDKSEPARASAAAQYVYRLADRSLARAGLAERLACRKGCALCCHVAYVSATLPQIFAVACAVRARSEPADDAARIATAEAITRGLDWNGRVKARCPCPLLLDEQCSIYPSRPLPCRHFVSFSLRACESAFEQGRGDIPAPDEYANLRSAYESALRAALKATGFDYDSYELNQALLTALQVPDAEVRWLRGEPIFDGVAIDTSADATSRTMRPVILDTLIALARGDPPPAFLGEAALTP